MTHYILQEQLHWISLSPSSPTNSAPDPSTFALSSPHPFTSPNDYLILPNDWPYGVSPNILHLVVWLKHRLSVSDSSGHLTPEAVQFIESFVQETFEKPLGDAGKERVLWFKNSVILQSVRGVEHFHVLVRDAPVNVIEGWVGGGRG